MKAARHDALDSNPQLKTEARGQYEHDAAVAFQNEMGNLKRDCEGRMRELDIRIKRLPPMPVADEPTILLRVEEAQLAAFRDWRERLTKSRLGALLNKRALNVFRRENRIIREVEHPSVPVAILGVLAIALLEATLNFNYLAPTGVGSPSEVLIFVISTAFLNVGLGLSCGFYGVRNLHHIKLYRRILGLVLIIFAIGIAGFLHCMLANYRHAIDIVSSDPTVQSDATRLLEKLSRIRSDLFKETTESPFSFVDDITAIIVFLYGMAFNLIAIWEGAKLLSDRYPGLAEHDRAYVKAAAHSEAANRGFRTVINGITAQANASLDAMLQQGDQRLQMVKVCVNDAINLARRYEEEATHIENTLTRMFTDYRDEYRQVRETRGPAFWEDDDPRLDREVSFDLDHLVQIEERENAELQSLTDRIEQIRSRLTSGQAELMTRVERYLEEIDQEAEGQDAALADIVGAETAPTG